MRLSHRVALAPALLAAFFAAACASRTADTAGAPRAAASAGYGTVVAVRPVLLAAAGPDARDMRASILGAIGGATAGAAGAGRPAEIIVRADDGATLSVVQEAAALRPGERVVIEPGAHTTLAPAGS